MSADALSLLREYVTEKKTVELKDGNFIFGDSSYPKATKTMYRSEKGKGEPYNLEAIWFYCSNASMTFGVYARACVKQRVKAIRVDDQKELLKYMTGQVDQSPCLDFSLVQQQDASTAHDTVREDEPAQATAEAKVSGVMTIDDIYAQEKRMSTRSSILQCKKVKDLTHVSKMFDQVVADRKRKKEAPSPTVQHGSQQHQRHSASPAAPDAKRARRTPDSTVPIIVVPQAMTAIINMYNAHDLLDKGIFVDPKKKREENPIKPQKLTFERASFFDKSKNCKYMVIDNITALKKEEWQRVVAVFVSGAEWQFKGWPWSSIASIFDNVCAFHIHYDDELLNPKIATWRCQRLTVSKIKRYKDRSTVLDMWNHLLDFVAARNADKELFF